MEANNRKNILILSLTLAVVMLGFGMVMPIFPFYIENMGCLLYTSDAADDSVLV